MIRCFDAVAGRVFFTFSRQKSKKCRKGETQENVTFTLYIGTNIFTGANHFLQEDISAVFKACDRVAAGKCKEANA